jgi:hypothetical protein
MKAILAPSQDAKREIDLGRGEELHEGATGFLAAGLAHVPRALGALAHGWVIISTASTRTGAR